jgi:Arc/MetJ family transcription regulator
MIRHLDININMHHDVYMRTTLTLDDDVAQKLADLAKESDVSFKVIVNDALRRGLGELIPAQPPFVLRAHAGGLRTHVDERRLNELAWEPESDL